MHRRSRHVVETYDPDGLEVEFVSAAGKTQAVITLSDKDVRKIEASDMLSEDMTSKAQRLSHIKSPIHSKIVYATPQEKAIASLEQIFHRNGYVRTPHLKKRQELGQKYKKGWEVRLVLRSMEELAEIRDLLQQAGLKAGRPFKKSKQWAQPIYGKKAVDFFSREALSHD